jgi:hypothetical protein
MFFWPAEDDAVPSSAARGRALDAMTPPHPMVGSAMTSKPSYFDNFDNCTYILGKAEHSACLYHA